MNTFSWNFYGKIHWKEGIKLPPNHNQRRRLRTLTHRETRKTKHTKT